MVFGIDLGLSSSLALLWEGKLGAEGDFMYESSWVAKQHSYRQLEGGVDETRDGE